MGLNCVRAQGNSFAPANDEQRKQQTNERSRRNKKMNEKNTANSGNKEML